MLLRLLMFVLAVTVLPAIADSAETPDYRQGQHYALINPAVRTHDTSKIEVVEIFWYGCPHCFQFQPLIKAWQERQQDDVDFRKIPAVFGDNLRQIHARAHFTAHALNLGDAADDAIFNAINMEQNTLHNAALLESFFASMEIDAETFRRTFNSFGVSNQVQQADSRVRGYGVRGTPEMIVEGRYRVSTSLNGIRSHADMLRVVDYLVERERSQRSAKQ